MPSGSEFGISNTYNSINEHGKGVCIDQNVITGGSIGITVGSSKGGIITNNIVTGTDNASVIAASFVEPKKFTGNTVTGNGVDFVGISQESSFTITDDSTGGDCTSIGTWNNAAKICKLSTNLTEGIIINSDKITLDGNGKSITGTYTSLNPSDSTFTEGVKIDGATGVTVKNLVINNVNSGIYLSSSENNLIIDNTLSNNGYGVNLYDSPNNAIRDNTITSDDGYGIKNDRSHLTIITGNTQSGASTGISVTNSNQLDINSNSFKNNQHGISLNNVGQNVLGHNVFESNLQNAIQIDGGGWHTLHHNTISSPWSASCGDSCYSNEGIRVSADAVYVHNNAISGAKIGINILDSSGNGKCLDTFNGNTGEEFWLQHNTISVLSSGEVTNGIKQSNSEKICYEENTITGTNGGDPRSITLNGDKNSVVKNNQMSVGNYGLMVSNS